MTDFILIEGTVITRFKDISINNYFIDTQEEHIRNGIFKNQVSF
jgi:hypothetical protein